MWCSRRALLAAPLLAPLALSACVGGYQPLGEGLRPGQVEVAAPASEDEYALVAALESRLGPAGRKPAYRLDYTVTVSEDPLGLRPDEAVQRYNVIARIDWRLTEVATGALRGSDRFSSFSSYSATESPVAGLSAQRDAHVRLMELLADQVVLQIQAALAGSAAIPAAGGAAPGI